MSGRGKSPTDPYEWVDSWAWPMIKRRDIQVPATAALVLLRLAPYGDGEGIAYPSTRTLADLVGRSDPTVRSALEALRDLGLIDGAPEPRRVTRWRFVTDDVEQQTLRDLRTLDSQAARARQAASANPSFAEVPVGDDSHLRSICEASANPSRAEGEGEELLSSPPAEAKEVEEKNGHQLIDFSRVLKKVA